MARIFGLLVVALLGFYVAWPAYSGYRIKTAVDTNDSQLLAQKVDFDQVRASLQPIVAGEAERAISAAAAKAGENAALLQQFKTQLLPKVIDGAMTTLITPETLLRIYRDQRSVREAITDIINEKLGGGAGLGGLGGLLGGAGGKPGGLGELVGGKLGGLFGNKGAAAGAQTSDAAPAAPADATGGTRRFSLSNVKSFALSGPAAYAIGIAKNAASEQPDVTVDLAFSGSDWKIVGVRPRL